MKARFLQRTHSAKAREEAASSNYSTARSMENSLLFDGIRTVVLPVVQPEDHARVAHDELQTDSSFVIRHPSF
jgi:hypothetical protein